MKVEIREDVEEVLEKRVKPKGGGGYIYLPKRWVGKPVKILLLKED